MSDTASVDDEVGSSPIEPPSSGDSPSPPEFKDRRPWLIAFGIVQVGFGLVFLAFAALMAAMAALGLPQAGDATTPPGSFLFAAVAYLVPGAAAVCLGFGSIFCQRWARALTLAGSWYGLVVGLVVCAVLLVIALATYGELGELAAEGEQAAIFVFGCFFLGTLFLLALVPGVFILFYRSPSVVATCEHHDSKPRWTDRCPTPVLIGGLMLASSVSAALAPLTGSPVPIFGFLATGPLAWAYGLGFGIAALVVAWGFLRLERWAWIGALALMAVGAVSSLLFFLGDGPEGGCTRP